MNNPIAVGITTSGTYAPMSATPIRATGTLVVGFPVGGGIGDAFAYIEGLGGADVPIAFGVPFWFERVDLSKLRLKSGVIGASPASFIGQNAD